MNRVADRESFNGPKELSDSASSLDRYLRVTVALPPQTQTRLFLPSLPAPLRIPPVRQFAVLEILLFPKGLLQLRDSLCRLLIHKTWSS